jgi:hypothetical protein
MIDMLFSWFPDLKWILIAVVVFAVAAPLLSIFSSSFSIVSSMVQVITPLLVATTEFIVWFVKELFDGVKVVLSSASAVVLLIVLCGGTALYMQARDYTNCKIKITDQKIADRQIADAIYLPQIDALRQQLIAAKIKPVKLPVPKKKAIHKPSYAVTVPSDETKYLKPLPFPKSTIF